MKRRYLVLLFTVFFMFLYIGPVNLLPYDVPSTIVQRPQEVKPELVQPPSVVATDYSVVLAADGDDDYWNVNLEGGASHVTGQTTVLLSHEVDTAVNSGQFRFQLNIPKDAVIISANFTGYETQDASTSETATVWRINEDDVGPLEDDSSLPSRSNVTTSSYEFDASAPEWNSCNITDLVQEQVDLEGWVSGQYFALRLAVEDIFYNYKRFEDYSHADNHPAYLNISYTGGEVVDPYGEDWLDGWGRRQQNNISQTAGTGINYTVPIYAWNGLGGSWLNNSYTNGYAQDDFDDIRWTQDNGSTELEYQLNRTWDGETTDYISNSSEDYGSYPVNYPSSVYYRQRTYISRQGLNRDPFITYYDHENDTWGGWYRVGDNSALHGDDDGHGAPCLFVDDEGYIHVFYGAHNTVIYHSKSGSPESLEVWIAQPVVDFGAEGSTYPHLFYDATNDVLHVHVRLTAGGGAGTYPLHYRNSTDKGLTWSSGQNIVEGDTYFPYTGPAEMDPTNTSLHIGWNRYTSANTSFQNVYYIEFNFTTGTVYNATGFDLGETVTYGELDDCLVYWSSQCNVWGPAIHLDGDTKPYLTWVVGDNPGESQSTIMFTRWTGSAWASVDNITTSWVWVGASDFIVHSSTNITAFLSESVSASRNMTKYTWDGDTWTRVEAIVQGGSTRYQGYNSVPMYYGDDEIQIVWSEYVPNDTNCKVYAYGSGGLVQYIWPERALFYVKVSDNLTDADATIYLYYANSAVSTTENATMTIDTGNDPDFDKWGAEEVLYYPPVNTKAPTFDNPDDTDNMYARYKEYNFTMYVSDQNGYANIDFLKLGFWDDGRSNNYARWRYDSLEDTFVEEYDWDDYFELNLTKSEAIKSGDVINCTFVFTVDWSCPDLTDVHMEVTVYDNNTLYDVDDHHFLTWDVETRLDFSTFSLDDGSGTSDRGDYDTLDGIVASGTVDYYGSAISPDSAEVDVWVSCSDVEGGPWSDTTLTAGVFSVTVDSDNVVGLDTYSFIVVEKGEGVGGSDLSHTSHSDTYIADRLLVEIQADDETPFNDQQVNFTLTIIYDYDDTVCSTYTIVVSRNAVWWHTFINGNKTLFNDTNSDVAYAYTTYDISESTHGLTKYSSGSESVTWSGAATTTTTTTFPTTTVTETGIFYELFLSLDMWGYLGPLGIVVIGYVLAKKDRGLGLIAFMVQCLIAAQYFALVSATPEYWWHIYIILFGGLFSCVIPLIDR